jgi:hypothetical protein
LSAPINIQPTPEGGEPIPVLACNALSPEDESALRRAICELRRSSLAMRLTSLIGRQMGNIGLILPPSVAEAVNRSAEGAIRVAMAVALRSLTGASIRDRRRLHKSVATLAGAAGGAFGLAGLPVELPFTTTVMLRSIADIAQGEGEDLTDPDVALACLEVFALGGEVNPSGMPTQGGGLETGYFAVRLVLAKSISESARYFLDRGLSEQAAPLLVRFIAQISGRFGVVVSQKVAAQSVPLIGAASGAAINYAFVDHFQTLARGHFTVRRLERTYGAALVRAEFDRLVRQA